MIPIFKLVFLYLFDRLPNNPGLILRSGQRPRLEGWATGADLQPSIETALRASSG
jgi:hypothetical protein